MFYLLSPASYYSRFSSYFIYVLVRLRPLERNFWYFCTFFVIMVSLGTYHQSIKQEDGNQNQKYETIDKTTKNHLIMNVLGEPSAVNLSHC